MNNQPPENSARESEPFVVWDGGGGREERASVLRLDRYSTAFQILGSFVVIHASAVLSGFRIFMGDRLMYSGRAVVSNVVNTGLALTCEASLGDDWIDQGTSCPNGILPAFDKFISSWNQLYKVAPEFKVAVADLQIFLSDLRAWLDQLELSIGALPADDRAEMEQDAIKRIEGPIIGAINSLHERFERLADKIDPEMRPVCQHFARRQLHSLFLCSPFGHRAYHKPLGYAGDYEMVNMICRSPYEGQSLFAKMINLWLLLQYPSVSHRNRIQYLTGSLVSEAMRVSRESRSFRVLNVGCGPAHETQEFLRSSRLSDEAEILLIDVNDETLDFARGALTEVKRAAGRSTRLQFQKSTAMTLLKESSKTQKATDVARFDLVMCAGLFDYLADRACRQLIAAFYRQLAPGGLVLVTNVVARKPFRHMLEFLLDWHLLYRDSRQLTALVPADLGSEKVDVKIEEAGTNLFLEIRAPR